MHPSILRSISIAMKRQFAIAEEYNQQIKKTFIFDSMDKAVLINIIFKALTLDFSMKLNQELEDIIYSILLDMSEKDFKDLNNLLLKGDE